MKRMSIQFHATPKEIITFVETAIKKLAPEAALLALRPFACSRLPNSSAGEAIAVALGETRLRVVFANAPIDCTAKTLNGFLDDNPDVVLLDIGRLSASGLEESCLSIQSNSAGYLKLAQQLGKILKQVTNVGAIAVNPETGEKAKLRSHRFTDEALALAKNGVKMLPVAGKSTIQFDCH